MTQTTTPTEVRAGSTNRPEGKHLCSLYRTNAALTARLTEPGVGRDSDGSSSVTPCSSSGADAITPNLDDGVGDTGALTESIETPIETTDEPDAGPKGSGTADGSAEGEKEDGPTKARRVCFFNRGGAQWGIALQEDHQDMEPLGLCPCESCQDQAKFDARHSVAQATGLMLYIKSLQSEIKILEEKLSKAGGAEKQPEEKMEVVETSEEKSWKVSIAWKRRTIERYGGVTVDDDNDSDLADPDNTKKIPSNDSILYVYKEFYVMGFPQNRPQYRHTTLEIHSPFLINLLREVVQYYPANTLTGDTVSFTSPYKALFHHRKALMAFTADEASDPETKRQVDLLLEFLEKNDPVTSKELDRLENWDMQLRQTCPFESLWIIYRPGSYVVYKDEHGHYQLYVVHSVSGQEKTVHSSGHTYRRPLVIKAWYLCYAGGTFNRVFNWLQVSYYEGVIDCSSLEFTPIAYFPEKDDLLAKLEARGMKYWSLQGSQFREYVRDVSDLGIHKVRPRLRCISLNTEIFTLYL